MFKYSRFIAFWAILYIPAAAISSHTEAGPEAKARGMVTGRQRTTAGSTAPKATGILWSADFETGDLSQWYDAARSRVNASGRGGRIFNSGIAESVASQVFAHSGRWSLKATITTAHAPTSGARLFRWLEPRRTVLVAVRGASIPGTTNTFGGTSATEYKTILGSVYETGTLSHRGSAVFFENYSQVLPNNPCR